MTKRLTAATVYTVGTGEPVGDGAALDVFVPVLRERDLYRVDDRVEHPDEARLDVRVRPVLRLLLGHMRVQDTMDSPQVLLVHRLDWLSTEPLQAAAVVGVCLDAKVRPILVDEGRELDLAWLHRYVAEHGVDRGALVELMDELAGLWLPSDAWQRWEMPRRLWWMGLGPDDRYDALALVPTVIHRNSSLAGARAFELVQRRVAKKEIARWLAAEGYMNPTGGHAWYDSNLSEVLAKWQPREVR